MNSSDSISPLAKADNSEICTFELGATCGLALEQSSSAESYKRMVCMHSCLAWSMGLK